MDKDAEERRLAAAFVVVSFVDCALPPSVVNLASHSVALFPVLALVAVVDLVEHEEVDDVVHVVVLDDEGLPGLLVVGRIQDGQLEDGQSRRLDLEDNVGQLDQAPVVQALPLHPRLLVEFHLVRVPVLHLVDVPLVALLEVHEDVAALREVRCPSRYNFTEPRGWGVVFADVAARWQDQLLFTFHGRQPVLFALGRLFLAGLPAWPHSLLRPRVGRLRIRVVVRAPIGVFGRHVGGRLDRAEVALVQRAVARLVLVAVLIGIGIVLFLLFLLVVLRVCAAPAST